MTGAGARAALLLEGELTIYRAAELKTVLLDALAAPGPLEIDLSGVTEIDTAGVQLLALARSSASAAGTDLHFAAPSPVVREVLGLLGLEATLAAPPALGARDES